MAGAIVCGIDGSEMSLRALAAALELVVPLSARLVLVHVAADEAGRRQGELVLAEAAVASQLGTGVDRVVVVGSPARELARLAEEWEASLLVVGSRGRGRIATAVLGSVALGLLESAPCPVVVVPPPREPSTGA